ncbi:hypothetical protein Glove_137g154 [Diversispora epigaea]|uniref:Serine aminopeptidase S33 domain-containing protein n=1 Tax=Diversispora epigaea TaxID=1348612 RepID=A0A397J6C7_9GLOM|nr:hypothetical protein Glove_137g154 [Diversispora epigaea]
MEPLPNFLCSLENTGNTFYNGFIEPILRLINLPPKDSTFGRASLPLNFYEEILRSEPYVHTECKIPFPFNGATDSFIYYQTWFLPTTKFQRNTDILYIHGLNEYGGRFSETCVPYLEQGFRVIGLDLPGFGRSSGLHAHFNNCNDLIEAVHEVINHLKISNDKKRKLILYGGSMGGMIILSYAIKYPDNFDALSVFAPLIYVSAESQPPKFVENIAKMLIKTPLGRLPIASAHSGKSSKDPNHTKLFFEDPLNYRGNLRCSTGLALKASAEWLELNLENISKPFLVQHGLSDRVTRFEGSKKLFDKAQTPKNQKQIILYEDCEHDMFRDKDSKDKVLEDVINWMISIDLKL